jgi:dihydrofolate reductase
MSNGGRSQVRIAAEGARARRLDGAYGVWRARALLYDPPMRPLRYSINVTLDGCVDHRAGIPNEETHRHATEGLGRTDALLMGRVIYQMMESAWREPARTGVRPDWMPEWAMPFARTIDSLKKYVVSNTLEKVDWNAELLRGDLGDAVRELKRQPGTGISVAGVTLPLALAEMDLIDEYEFLLHPRIAGHGPSLLAGLSKPLDLRLVEKRELDGGFLVLRYEPVG